ncbi:MAG: hypothetical protein KKB50_13195 [Planctomycetes bacterium]|nr:hypothetical protein [Planctomycetota bacterium]
MQPGDCARDNAVPLPPRYWWLKRLVVAFVLVAVLVGALRWWAGRTAQRRLDAQLAAYRAAGQPVLLADFDRPPVPDEQNAVALLNQAQAALVRAPQGCLDFADIATCPPLCAAYLEQARAIVAANQPALDLVRAARSRPQADWGLRLSTPVINVLLPMLGPQREIAKLLSTAALYEHEVGNDAAAVEALHDVLLCVDWMDELRFTILSHLVAVSISTQCVRTIEYIAPRLVMADVSDAGGQAAPRARVEALIAALLDEDGLRNAWRWAMYSERMLQLDSVQALCNGTMGMSAIGASVGGPTPVGLTRPLEFALRPFWTMDALHMARDATAVANAGLAENWPAGRAQLPAEPVFDSTLERLARMLSTILQPSLTRIAVLHFRALAERRLAATALAIRLYELDHGERPATLAELVPDYLPAVRADPFAADGRPLAYLTEAPQPILYSIGTDGADDGGAYALTDSGGVAWDERDMPFFLDRERPYETPSFPSTQPASTQAVDQ